MAKFEVKTENAMAGPIQDISGDISSQLMILIPAE